MTARNTAALKTAKAEKITRCRLSSLLSTPFSIRQLSSNDVVQMEEMLTVFGNAFNEAKTYTGKPPGSAYLQRLLDFEEWFGGGQHRRLRTT